MKVMDRIAAKVTQKKVPACFQAQASKLAALLPYETVLNRNRPLFLMSDGALGVMWEIDAIAHETVELSELARKLEALSKIFLSTSRFQTAFQVIYDSAPCYETSKPSWFDEPKTFEQRVMKHRIDCIEKEAENTAQDDLRLLKRKVFVTLRLAHVKEEKVTERDLSAELNFATQRLAELEAEIDTFATEIEGAFMRAKFRFAICQQRDFLKLVKEILHSEAVQKGSFFDRKSIGRLSDALVDDFVQFDQDKITVGTDAWQTLSLRESPQDVYDGLMSGLLQIKVPVRVVVNIRPSEDSDLSKKEYFLRNARDAFSARQQKDVKGALESLAYGEKLLDMSLHILVRHKKEHATEFSFESTRRAFENTLGLALISERFAAPLVFWSCLPFAVNKMIALMVARERLILSSRLPSILPLFCGFKGTGDKLRTQILQNRAGEYFWLSMRASDTSSHLACLASSGAGKSFLCTNILTSERAANESSMTFIIDKRTSYEVLATTFGQEKGFQIVKPPDTFPNLFKGDLDEEGERLRCIVNVLKTAISLASPGEHVDAIRTNILGLAVQKTFEDINLDSATEFDLLKQVLQTRFQSSHTVPRLSEVVDNLASVCERGGFEVSHAKWLRDKLSPFYGSGPYANLFDIQESIAFENPTPSVSLYDLEGVSGDKILSTLTALIIISDIVRQIKRKENRGRSNQLIIDEAGVIGSDSPEIANFIDDGWKTFRKLNCMGVGLTNMVSDYKYKAGPRTIWAVSPNKIILRMSQSEIDDAFKETKDAPALLQGELTKSLVESLVKKDGVYSQGLFISQETTGSFHFKATGFDYWLAASKPEEVATVHMLAKKLGGGKYGYETAVTFLAEKFPKGVRDDSTNAVRGLQEAEIDELVSSIQREEDACRSA